MWINGLTPYTHTTWYQIKQRLHTCDSIDNGHGVFTLLKILTVLLRVQTIVYVNNYINQCNLIWFIKTITHTLLQHSNCSNQDFWLLQEFALIPRAWSRGFNKHTQPIHSNIDLQNTIKHKQRLHTFSLYLDWWPLAKLHDPQNFYYFHQKLGQLLTQMLSHLSSPSITCNKKNR